MPTNRNALIRYKTIDQCLQNRYRQWTLNALIEAVSDALYEYEGIDNGISKRTVQSDIQMMRSDKLGYNAPIVVVDRKFYTYEDPNYSITNIPLTDQDLGKLSEAVEFLKQFQGFSHFKELGGMVQKLEDHIHSAKTKNRPIIDFETNPNLKGLEYLDKVYKAILNKKVLKVEYRSFKAHRSSFFQFHTYLLKEFNNRWFMLGSKNEQSDYMTLALDRIVSLQVSEKGKFREREDFDANNYYKDIIGVTAMEGMLPEQVIIKLDNANAPYTITKPIHASQEILEKEEDGVIFSLKVKINFELERLILGYGECAEVLAPLRLRKKIRYKLNKAAAIYEPNSEN